VRTQPTGVAVSADQLTLELPGLPALRLVDPPPRRLRRPTPDEPPTPAAVGERVWLVWEDDEVLGIYADPRTAAAECAALRRHAQRDQLQVHYEWMAVPVFTDRRHQPPTVETRGVTGRRW